MDDLEEFLDIFVEEAADGLAVWERICLDLEEDASDERINELFRAAHTIKGSSAAMGLEQLSAFVHKAEELLNAIRRKEREVTSSVAAVLLDCQGVLVDWIERLRNRDMSAPEVDGIVARFAAIGESEAAPVPASGDKTASEPPVAAADAPKISTEDAAPPAGPPDGIASPVAASSPASPSKTAAPRNTGPVPGASQTLRVPAQKIDALINTIGELAIHQQFVGNAVVTGNTRGPRVRDAVALILKITKELQFGALGMRMQPVQGLFQRLERTAKMVARDLGKRLRVDVCGSHVELDRIVVERITEPLVHVVRNAVDHGLESHDGRRAAGKSAEGVVRIEARQVAAGVQLVVRDDGRGLDADRIRAKAVERGLIDEGADLRHDEVLNLVFRPGFSTAEKVTSVSGRGVGMDVVKTTVDQLNGSVRIESTLGQGSAFVVTLPTSVSIIDALVVRGSRFRDQIAPARSRRCRWRGGEWANSARPDARAPQARRPPPCRTYGSPRG